jgi:hypothetical protein
MIASLKHIFIFPEKNFLRADMFLFISICLLLICGIKVTWNLEQYMDVLFWDESIYLKRGTLMFDFIPKDWGPSYSLWYKFLSVFITDNVKLYYFNFKLTSILVAVSFYLLMLSCGVERILAFILSLFFLGSFINMPVWPRISHFCIIVIVNGLIVAKFFTSTFLKFIIYSFVFLICAYARPELYLLFMLCFVVCVSLFFYKIKQYTKLELGSFFILLILFSLTYILYKTPFNNGDSSRSIKVFLQHFAFNLAEWKMVKGAFWIEFIEVDKKYFNAINSLPSIISSNSALFFKHIFYNLQNYCTQTFKIIVSFFFPVFTKTFHWLSFMIGLMFFAIYFSFGFSIDNFKKNFIELLKGNCITIFLLSLILIPTIFICIYAYPRSHYLIMQVPFLILVGAIILSSFDIKIEKEINKSVVIATIWFFVTPAAEDFSYFSLFREEESFCNQATIKYIKKNFSNNNTVSVFDVEGGLTNLLSTNFTDLGFYYTDNKNIEIGKYIKQKKIDILYITPTLLMLNKSKTDSVLNNLIKEPQKYGYVAHKTGTFTPYLLIKKDIE